MIPAAGSKKHKQRHRTLTESRQDTQDTGMSARFREFFVKHAALPGACGMLTIPAKRTPLPCDPVAGEDLIALFDKLVDQSGGPTFKSVEYGSEQSDSSPPPEECLPVEQKKQKAPVKRKKRMSRNQRIAANKKRACDKENHKNDQKTSTENNAVSTNSNKQPDADLNDNEEDGLLTSSGFLVTVLSDSD